MTREKLAMHIAGVVAVIGIAAAGTTITSEGASECERTRGEGGGTAESKDDCKSSYVLT